MNQPILTYDRVEISYSGHAVTHEVSFELHEGEVLGLVGESGSGKSALIKAAMGLLGDAGLVTGGDILYQGQSLPDMPLADLRTLCGPDLAMIFQDCLASFSPTHTIGFQMREALAFHGHKADEEADLCAIELMDKLRVPDPERVLAGYPFQLSGGMGQRVGIALALLMRPKVLFADEPTSALDAISQKRVIEELGMLQREFETAIILVTHNIDVVRALADTVVVLKQGRVVEYGPAGQTIACPQNEYTRQLIEAAPQLVRSGSAATAEADCKKEQGQQ